MAETDLTTTNRSDRSADDWEQRSTTRASGGDPARPQSWLGARLETTIARFTQRFSRRPSNEGGEESTALVRTGGPLARWISFPRGGRLATAATASAAAGLAARGMIRVPAPAPGTRAGDGGYAAA